MRDARRSPKSCLITLKAVYVADRWWLDAVVLTDVVGFIERCELTMLDHQPHSMCPELIAEIGSMVASVSVEDGQPVEVLFDQLSADLGVVWLFHRAVDIWDGSSRSIDQHCRPHRLERVIRSGGVLSTGGDSVKATDVDCLNITKVVERVVVFEKCQPCGHVDSFFRMADCRILGQCWDAQLKSSDDVGHLVKDVQELPVGKSEMLFETMHRASPKNRGEFA